MFSVCVVDMLQPSCINWTVELPWGFIQVGPGRA